MCLLSQWSSDCASQVQLMGRRCTRVDYYFQGGHVPDNYTEVRCDPCHAS